LVVYFDKKSKIKKGQWGVTNQKLRTSFTASDRSDSLRLIERAMSDGAWHDPAMISNSISDGGWSDPIRSGHPLK
jgi:hypothetical protein